ncbi:hypothetical protein, partial [uncultured Alcanivorax sp.]|uniref:hypothetical protein n=1 Tax=uncultured Alcanivorax sp. TaxID=191215 RepID=UPI0026156822
SKVDPLAQTTDGIFSDHSGHGIVLVYTGSPLLNRASGESQIENYCATARYSSCKYPQGIFDILPTNLWVCGKRCSHRE